MGTLCQSFGAAITNSHCWPVAGRHDNPKMRPCCVVLAIISFPLHRRCKTKRFEQPYPAEFDMDHRPIRPWQFLCTPHKGTQTAETDCRTTNETGNGKTRTSSSLVVSRTRFCTTCWVALAPTRPPRPGPCTGNSGLRLFRGSCLSLSRLRLLGSPDVNSPSRVTPGMMIAGAATASDMSSTVGRLAGPLLSNNLAPLRDV